jgi:protein disulfide-isomerase-like protein
MSSDLVVELTPNDFDGKTLKKYKDKIVLVKFYAPWCGYCKRAEPGYKELAKQYKNDKKVVIAKFDCDKYPEFMENFNKFANGPKIPGYPTILLYKNGVLHKEPYQGNREVVDYINFLNKFY